TARSDPAWTMAVPGMSVRRCPHYIGRQAGHLESRASSVAFDATSGGRPGASRGQAAARDLCRGTARSAALRGGPAGRRKQVILESPAAEDTIVAAALASAAS